MKFVFSIRESEKETFFSLMRNEYEYARLVLAVMEKILISKNEHKKPDDAYILMDKETFPHRLFIVSKSKIVSFVFDFTVVSTESEFSSISFREYVLSAEIVACAKMIVNQLTRIEREWIHEEDNDLQGEFSLTTLDISHKLIKQIIYSEPSYIRYEYDVKHEKGSKHPLHHLDINYSKEGTYKIGVNSHAHSTDIRFLMELLSAKADCFFLQKI